ncbi:hypothetical protein PVW48_16015 [Dinoroseobacter sp. PD6]|uniref:hypothetical protein n=1 Tax=Dinoroseobacter sp. PD6 TaxID=3028384 RepID=UPI00237B6E14|nr:hypothetical protein [Dinoroseobacter sp. PD6]MDD9718269.1 hypothetical protein [Dinoroseobacter sp. PD6]
MRRILDVILHVGAHRTGTTSLQQTLRRNASRLRASSVAVWEPNVTRAALFDGLVKAADRVTPEVAAQARVSSARVRGELDRLRGTGMRTLIVSEENMLGAIPACVASGQLYPDAARRMARFRPAFGAQCTRIGLAIRNYERHWTSMLGFTVKHGGRVPDRDRLGTLVDQPRRWRDVIRELQVVFPGAELVVWPFEALVDVPHLLVSGLTRRVLPAPLEPVPCIHNASPDVALLRKVVAEGPCPHHLARLPEAGPWRPFSAAQIARMRAAYDDDIAWLRSGAAGAVTYIESPECIAGLTGPERGVDHDERQRRVG